MWTLLGGKQHFSGDNNVGPADTDNGPGMTPTQDMTSSIDTTLTPEQQKYVKVVSDAALKALCEKAAQGGVCDCVEGAVFLPGGRQQDYQQHYMGGRGMMMRDHPSVPFTVSRASTAAQIMSSLRARREASPAQLNRTSGSTESTRLALVSPPGGSKSHFVSEFSRLQYDELRAVLGEDLIVSALAFNGDMPVGERGDSVLLRILYGALANMGPESALGPGPHERGSVDPGEPDMRVPLSCARDCPHRVSRYPDVRMGWAKMCRGRPELK
ncbi:hypothetical protein B484DRAFT_399319 [Ochromonadaceae sp. CCMP2298]|nr:hypothetical protein B484DRAFT_399319 [Ochromonadaceae sp. CCMP2298]